MPKRFGRRTFLRASAGAALAGAVYGSNLRLPSLTESRPATVRKVLTEEVRLGPPELTAGSLSGLSAQAQGLALNSGSTGGEYVSHVLKSGVPFHFAGVHWSGASVDETALWLRTSADGRTWSDWTPVHVDLPPGPLAEDDHYGALIAAPGHLFAQVKAEMRSGNAGAVLRRVGVTLLNPYDGPLVEAAPEVEVGRAGGAHAAELDPRSSVGPEAALAKPLTFSREAWGCDESLRFSDGQEKWPRSYVPSKKLVVHHTATGNGYFSVGDAMAHVRSVYTYHTITQGWGDIGYNCLVDKFGNSYEGRRGRDGPGYDGPGGREIMSQDLVAGHALVYNYGSTGIALLGDFTASSPGGAMLGRLEEVLAYEALRRGIRGDEASDFLIHNTSWHRGLPHIVGHRDVGETGCPGPYVHGLLPQIRRNVKARTTDPAAPDVRVVMHPAQDTIHDNRVQFAWQGSGGSGALEYSYYLEGWARDPDGMVAYIRGFNGERLGAWSDWAPNTDVILNLGSHAIYTFHIRVRDSSGRMGTYQDTRSFLGQAPTVADGAVLVESGPVYVVQNGIKRHVPNPVTFFARGITEGEITRVSGAALNAVPTGRPILDTLASGNLIKGSGHPVYVTHAGAKRHIAGQAAMESCGYGWDALLKPLPDPVLASITEWPAVHGPPCPHLLPPDGSIITGNGPIYLIQGGLKRHVPNLLTFEARGLHWGNLDRIGQSSVNSIPTGRPLLNAWDDGNLIKGSGPEVYVMEAGQKRHVASQSAMDQCGYEWAAVQWVNDHTLAAIPTGAPLFGPPCPHIVPPDGAVIVGNGPQVYLMRGGLKRHAPNPLTFDVEGMRWGDLDRLHQSIVSRIPTGQPLLDARDDGNLIRSSGPEVYVMGGGRKRHILSPSAMAACGYEWDAVHLVSESSLATVQTGSNLSGPPCPEYLPPQGTLVKGVGRPEVYVIDAGRRRHILSPAIFGSCYEWGNLNLAPDSSVANIPAGPALSGPPCP